MVHHVLGGTLGATQAFKLNGTNSRSSLMKLTTIIFAGAIFTGAAVGALAHGDATGIVKERMHGMMAMGKALGSVADMFKGKTKFNAQGVEEAADIVLQHTATIDKLFPDTDASRNGKGTEAIPAIWEDRKGFLAIATELEKRATELRRVAASGNQDQIRTSFGAVAKSCSACHQDYRKKKE